MSNKGLTVLWRSFSLSSSFSGISSLVDIPPLIEVFELPKNPLKVVGTVYYSQIGAVDYERKIINIHPSLLPAFKGLNAIDQAINYGVKVSGITTHFINKEIDLKVEFPFNVTKENVDKLIKNEEGLNQSLLAMYI